MTTDDTARPTIDWREWIAFLGYVLATAVVVAVVLGSLVLVISMQADDTGAAGNAGSPLGAAIVPAVRSQPAMPVLPGAPAAARNEAAPGLPAGPTQ